MEADGEQDEDGCGAQHHVGWDVDVTERDTERPRPVAVQRRERAHRKHAAAEQQVGDGQRQQEVVGRRAQLPVGADSDTDEQVPADRDDDERHEGQPNAGRFCHAVARRKTAYVTSGLALVRRRLRDVICPRNHCATRHRMSSNSLDQKIK